MDYDKLHLELEHIHQLETSIKSYLEALESLEKAKRHADFKRKMFKYHLDKAKYIEQELRDQTEEFSFLFDKHDVLVGIVNDDGKTEYASWAKDVYKVQNGDAWKG